MSTLPELVTRDPYLIPYAERIRQQIDRFQTFVRRLETIGGIDGDISLGHRYFGFQEDDRSLVYREWAPGAHQLYLIGDFNGWDRRAHPMERDSFGTWHLSLPAGTIPVESRLKVHVLSHDGPLDRIPAYIRRTVQEASGDFVGRYLRPTPPPPPLAAVPGGALRIYEAHVGMATEERRVGTFAEFEANVLPRIARLGYNAVQLMAIQEHPYYGSFGYHVSSFYAVSSRFGTPEELKSLIAAAHRLGLRVLMDLVHSHAVRNVFEGLNRFDGTDHLYFHAGPRGEHPAWDSRLFDYSKFEVQRFLLSNVRYWLDEFGFDGFRFDGVTSMLYRNHGLGGGFHSYADYFGDNVDPDALLYLQLANALAHTLRPDAITVAEDVSGMPGMARPVAEGGLGFDYRLSMGVPDLWIRTVKTLRDEEWRLGDLWATLLHRRHDEKHIGYAESHDQSIVGDKTLAFWLMDAAMYTQMGVDRESLAVSRGVALHKLIRLLTFAASGDGWLNFMGNEFGHPEWVDFPREGNGWSYDMARRQWSLADDPHLRYGQLEAFDGALQALDRRFGILTDPLIELLALDERRKLLVFRRGVAVVAMNFHADASYADLRLPVPDASDYVLVLNSDGSEFGGHGNSAAPGVHLVWEPVPAWERPQSVRVYLPARSAQVFVPMAADQSASAAATSRSRRRKSAAPTGRDSA